MSKAWKSVVEVVSVFGAQALESGTDYSCCAICRHVLKCGSVKDGVGVGRVLVEDASVVCRRGGADDGGEVLDGEV